MITLSVLFYLVIMGGLAGLAFSLLVGLFKVGAKLAFLPVVLLGGLLCIAFLGIKLLIAGLPFILLGVGLSALLTKRQTY